MKDEEYNKIFTEVVQDKRFKLLGLNLKNITEVIRFLRMTRTLATRGGLDNLYEKLTTPNQPRKCCNQCYGRQGTSAGGGIYCLDSYCVCHAPSNDSSTSSSEIPMDDISKIVERNITVPSPLEKEYNHPNLRCIRCDKQIAECKCPELETRPVASPLVPEGGMSPKDEFMMEYIRHNAAIGVRYGSVVTLDSETMNELVDVLTKEVESQTRNSVLEEITKEIKKLRT